MLLLETGLEVEEYLEVEVTAVSSSLGDGEYVELIMLIMDVVVTMLLLEIGLVVEYMEVVVTGVSSSLGDGEYVELVTVLLLEVDLVADEYLEDDVTAVWPSLGDDEDVVVTVLLLGVGLVEEEDLEVAVLGDKEDVYLVELVFLLV